MTHLLFWYKIVSKEVKEMPRGSRKKSESKMYHVMIRGNERKEIFLDDDDKLRFIEILKEKKQDKKYSIYAYCLMDNHVHLLVNEGNETISQIMKKINISYAYYFNKKYSRIGHLFQDRFKSEAIEDEGYLLSAVRYIHNNPVKAHIVMQAEDYKWSSYGLYVGKCQYAKDSIDEEFILGIFSCEREKAVELFKEFSRQENQDSFIEYKEEEKVNKTIQNEQEAKEYIIEQLRKHNVSLEEITNVANIRIRNDLIVKLKNKSSLSVRQIAEILGIGRNIVQRVQ
ncbi:transposase [Sporomusa acidovorans]